MKLFNFEHRVEILVEAIRESPELQLGLLPLDDSIDHGIKRA